MAPSARATRVRQLFHERTILTMESLSAGGRAMPDELQAAIVLFCSLLD